MDNNRVIDSDDRKPATNNEEIIEDLTKNLESQEINETTNPSDPDILEKLVAENEDSESEPQTSKDKNFFNDLIDEEKMKEDEKDLSDEEKEKRKIEADTLKEKGNDQFKTGNYLESISIYTSALNLCPLSYVNERSVLYSNRSASKIKLDYKEAALEDCTKAVELNPNYVKALLRRAKLYESMDKLDECLEDYKKLLTLDESNTEYKHIVYVLSQKIEKRNEEMKTEMLGKLKDLGNLFLKPFGLSTDNFKLDQDPNSGGYSVNFVQKK